MRRERGKGRDGDGSFSSGERCPLRGWNSGRKRKRVRGGSHSATFRVCDGKGGLATVTQAVSVSDPARQFTQRTSGTTKNLNAIATNGTLAVAVGGNSGVILTSSDGVAWTTRTVPDFAANMNFRAAVWDGSKFIVAGSDYNFSVPGWVGGIYTSPDGISWTQRYLGSTAGTEIQALASDGTASVATGDSGTILQSVDGVSWLPVTLAGLGSTSLKGVAWNAGNYIATGHSGGNGTPRVLTSVDRVNWIDVTAGAGLDSWQDLRKIAWLNNRFVASGWYSKVRVSTDAGNSFSTSRADSEDTPALAFGDGIYFAGGVNRSASNADIDLLLLDGAIWIPSAAPTTSDRYGGVLFQHTRITVGAGGTIWQSADLTPSGSGGNQPPTFAGYNATTPSATPLVIPAATLIAATGDPEGDPVLLTAAGPASAQGGTVSSGGASVNYVPASGFSGTDSIPVTFTAARGAMVNGTVNVTVEAAVSVAPGPVALVLAGGQATLSFQGGPGQTYTVERSTDLDDWVPAGTATAAANGAFNFTDSAAPAGKAYYRIVLPYEGVRSAAAPYPPKWGGGPAIGIVKAGGGTSASGTAAPGSRGPGQSGRQFRSRWPVPCADATEFLPGH